jgi:hypothetical protein
MEEVAADPAAVVVVAEEAAGKSRTKPHPRSTLKGSVG